MPSTRPKGWVDRSDSAVASRATKLPSICLESRFGLESRESMPQGRVLAKALRELSMSEALKILYYTPNHEWIPQRPKKGLKFAAWQAAVGGCQDCPNVFEDLCPSLEKAGGANTGSLPTVLKEGRFLDK